MEQLSKTHAWNEIYLPFGRIYTIPSKRTKGQQTEVRLLHPVPKKEVPTEHVVLNVNINYNNN